MAYGKTKVRRKQVQDRAARRTRRRLRMSEQRERRRLHLETLEGRQLLAADLALISDSWEPADVNGDGWVSPHDVVAVIDQWSVCGDVPANWSEDDETGLALDVTGDGLLTGADVDAVMLAAAGSEGDLFADGESEGSPEEPTEEGDGDTDDPPEPVLPDIPLPDAPWSPPMPSEGPTSGPEKSIELPPLVWMTVDDDEAKEENQETAAFTVHRAEAAQEDLTVKMRYYFGLTNERDVVAADLKSYPESIVIPAGKTSVTVVLTPVDDRVIEENEQLTIAVFDPPDEILSFDPYEKPYTVDMERQSGSITILDNEWRWIRTFDDPNVDRMSHYDYSGPVTPYSPSTLSLRDDYRYAFEGNKWTVSMIGALTVPGIFRPWEYSIDSKLEFSFVCDPTTGVIAGGPVGGGATDEGPLSGGLGYQYTIDDDPQKDLHVVNITATSHAGAWGQYSTGTAVGGVVKGGSLELNFTKTTTSGGNVFHTQSGFLACRKGPLP